MCRQEEFPASGGDYRTGAGNGRIHFVKEIPKTPAGKIVKNALEVVQLQKK
jgi:non-ribosomal peptide synthetase component E (peptide arylation enzyme)